MCFMIAPKKVSLPKFSISELEACSELLQRFGHPIKVLLDKDRNLYDCKKKPNCDVFFSPVYVLAHYSEDEVELDSFL